MAKTRRQKERRRGTRRADRHERRHQQHSGGSEWDCISIPDGLEVFKPEKGETYHIDVLPYIVGKLNKNADPGDEYFELSYPVYRGLGIDEKKYVAIGEMCGERDPVGEHFAQLRKEGAEWADMKMFKPTWRQLMLIFVHEQAEKGLQLFEGAYGTFGELLDEEIKANDEEFIDNFDDPDGGATLLVRFKAKSIGRPNPWILASKINFEEREEGFTANGDEALAAEVLERAGKICLDDILKIPDYGTLKRVLDGEPLERPAGPEEEPEEEEPEEEEPEEEEPEEKPARKPKSGKARKPPTAADLGIVKGSTVEHDEFGECVVIRVAKNGAAITLKDEDDEIHKDIDVTDVEPIEPEEEEPEEEEPEKEEPEEEPARKPKSSKTKAAEPADDDWDDDWDD